MVGQHRRLPDEPRITRRRALAAVGGGMVALSGCTSGGTGSSGNSGGGTGGNGGGDTTGDDPAWRTATLTDVLTGEEFTIRSFEGRPALLEFFAVWCPVCTTQQRAIGSLLEDRENVAAVSINTDPNEDVSTVRDHAEEHGFDWRYVVASPELTRSFVDGFGNVVTSAPSAPVVQVCPDGTASLLQGRGAKSADDLAEALDAC